MNTFKNILLETHKVYPFKIGIAGDLPDGCEESVKSCLQKYAIKSMSAGKKTPIQKRPLDFPQLENIDVHYYEVELQYPTTGDTLQEYIGQCCGIDASHIIVRSPLEQQELYQEEKDEGPYEAKLTQEDMGGESAQEDAGGNRVMNLLKELETARKERDDADSGYKMEQPLEEPTNNKSAIGS